ncbi:hypothetical protein V6N13_130649 [Hibiscus sabdariffa]|uniref:Uncharacterized protein n=2 Tax=Hibiscus sabdariffa TaxID=183260 RepID=A0ABR2P049_9ROSI
MDIVVFESTTARRQRTGCGKFLGFDAERSGFRFDGLEAGVTKGASGARVDGLRIYEFYKCRLSSEEPKWMSDETMASLDRANDKLQMGMDIEEFERKP